MWKFDRADAFFSKKKNIFLLYGIVRICILLLMFSSCEGEQAAPAEISTLPETAPLEDTLKQILSQIRGVGKVQVAVTYESGVETVPAQNRHGESDSVVPLGSGAGARVATVKEKSPTVRGVIVVAQGAGSAAVRKDILNAVAALTGAPPSSIGIFTMK